VDQIDTRPREFDARAKTQTPELLVKDSGIRNTSFELTELQNILFGQLGIDLTCPEEIRGVARYAF
jgi:hypothetical protein